MSNLPGMKQGAGSSNLAASIQGNTKKDEGGDGAELSVEELAALATKEREEADAAQALLDAAKAAKVLEHSYVTIGEPVFSCNGATTGLICFVGGSYTTDSDEEAEVLAHFVKIKRIKKV